MELMVFLALVFSGIAIYAAYTAVVRVNQLVDFVHAAKALATAEPPCEVCEGWGDSAICWKCGRTTGE